MQLSYTKKRIGVFMLAMINVIAIDSLRNLPTNAEYGFSVITMYILGTLFFLLPCIFLTAELSTNRPLTGGSYIWIRDAFGNRWGFIGIWLLWIYNVIWFPTILAFLASSVAYLINPALADHKGFMVTIIIAAFLLSTIANMRGLRTASWLSTIGAVFGTIIPMALIIALGAAWFIKGNPSATPLDAKHLIPGVSNVNDLAFVVVILFSLVGIEMSGVHAEEVRDPKKNFPRALLISAVIIVITSTLASLAIAVVLPAKNISLFSGVNQAFQAFLNAYHLGYLLPVAVILVILGGFGTMSAWVLGPAKAMMVAAKDGCAPVWLGKPNKHGAPGLMLITQAVIVVVLSLLFLFFDSFNAYYWILSDLTSQLALLYYILLFAAAIRLRYITPPQEGAYLIPGGKFGSWLVNGIGALASLAAIALGFLPATGTGITSVMGYELTLIFGILIFCLPPVFIYRRRQE